MSAGPIAAFNALEASIRATLTESANHGEISSPVDEATMLTLFAFHLPKVELHAHLNGSISMALLRHLGRVRPAASDISSPSTTTTTTTSGASSSAVLSLEDDALLSIRGAKERMAYCFGAFDCVYRIMDNLKYTRLAVQDMLLHYAVEMMMFLEIRTSLREGMKTSPEHDAPIATQADYLRTVRDTISSILSGSSLFDWTTGDAINPGDGDAMTRWLAQLDDIYGTSCFLPRRVHVLLANRTIAPRHIVRKQHNAATGTEKADMMMGSLSLTPSLLFRLRIQPHLQNMRCVLTVSISRSLPIAAAYGTMNVVEMMLQEEKAHTEDEDVTKNPSSVLITGIDFSGNCYKQNFSDFDDILRQLREKHGLSITIHAGEKDDDEELQQMISYAPDRWGHMIFAGDALRRVIDFGVKKPIELCPSSNMLTCGHDHMDEHHIGQHWEIMEYVSLYDTTVGGDEGDNTDAKPVGRSKIARTRAPISINTDDRGVFASSMTDELLLVAGRKDVCQLDSLRTRMMLLFVLQRRALEDGFYPRHGCGEVFALRPLETLFDIIATR